MIESGKAPYPVERTLLTSGSLEGCLASQSEGHARVATPHLTVSYKAPEKFQFPQA